MVLYSFHPIDWTKVHILIEPNKHFKKKQHKILSRGNPLFFRTFPRLINTILPIIILRETIFLVSLQQNNDIIMAQEIIGREPEIKGLYGPLEKVCGYRSTIKILFCPFIKLNNG